MNLRDEVAQINTIFIDTAPFIYYIEAHSLFGPLVREVINALESEKLRGYSSVITLVEVLPKPVQEKRKALAREFIQFLRRGKNLALMEISADIAEEAGKLRGKYPHLKTLDAIQISTALNIGVDAFLTNDNKLRRIKDIKVIILSDYL